MKFNLDFIISQWKGFNKAQKVFGLTGIGIFLYLFYLKIKKIRKNRKIQKQKEENEQLRVDLLATKQIHLNNTEVPFLLDVISEAQQTIFKELVDLYITGEFTNITEEISKRFHEAFKDTLDALGNGQGKNWRFAIDKIDRLANGFKPISLHLIITK